MDLVNNIHTDILQEAGRVEDVSSHSGSQYDPAVVAACLRLFREKGSKFEGSSL
jgi:hypothetical protein